MGQVFRAHDTVTNRIAVKVLPAQLAQDRQFQQRFQREANTAAALTEPHIVPIHGFGEIDGQLYVDMRFIDGVDLQTLLADGPLDPARTVMIIEQVAAALDAAHQAGLVHRDVKPSNILIAKFDFAYLIDFGIARAMDETSLTGTGNMIGTWPYMAPERFRDGHIDHRSDIYALACVLHECLTGTRPFPGNSLEQQFAGHMTTTPPRPSMTNPGVPAQFDAVIARGMAKNPDERYSTAIEFANEARAALTSTATRPSLPPAPSAAEGVSPWDQTQQRERAQFVVPPTRPQTDPGGMQRLSSSGRGRVIALVSVAVLVVITGAALSIWQLTSPSTKGGPSQTRSSQGPQPTVQRTQGTVVLVIDVSQSMRATDVAPSRLAAAMDGAKRFAQRLNPRLNLGLGAFAGTATVLVSPTTDGAAVEAAIDRLQLADRTATGEGIFTALQSIGVRPAWIVLQSDGRQTISASVDAPRGAYSAARAAKANSVIISTISLGTPDGTVDVNNQAQPVPVDDDELREIANIAGGSFHHASSLDELNDAYDSLVKEIG